MDEDNSKLMFKLRLSRSRSLEVAEGCAVCYGLVIEEQHHVNRPQRFVLLLNLIARETREDQKTSGDFYLLLSVSLHRCIINKHITAIAH